VVRLPPPGGGNPPAEMPLLPPLEWKPLLDSGRVVGKESPTFKDVIRSLPLPRSPRSPAPPRPPCGVPPRR